MPELESGSGIFLSRLCDPAPGETQERSKRQLRGRNQKEGVEQGNLSGYQEESRRFASAHAKPGTLPLQCSDRLLETASGARPRTDKAPENFTQLLVANF